MRKAALTVMAGLAIGCDPPPKPEDFVAQSVQPLPERFTTRNALTDPSGLASYTLEEQVGRVLYLKPGDPSYTVTGRVLLPAGYAPAAQLIDQDRGKVYEGLLNKELASDASYLAVAAKLTATNLATLNIQDRAFSRIANSEVPWLMLSAEAKRPRPDPSTKVYWVQGVLLASIDYKIATEYNANAGGKLSEAFSANGRIYDKTETATHDHHLSMELIDLDHVLDNERSLLNAARTQDSTVVDSIVTRRLQPLGLRFRLPKERLTPK